MFYTSGWALNTIQMNYLRDTERTESKRSQGGRQSDMTKDRHGRVQKERNRQRQE